VGIFPSAGFSTKEIAVVNLKGEADKKRFGKYPGLSGMQGKTRAYD